VGRIVKANRVGSRPKAIHPDTDKAAADLLAAHAVAARIREETKDDVIELALIIAEKVIGKMVALDPTVLDSIYQKALAAGRELPNATLTVHPDDRAAAAVVGLAKAYRVDVVDDPEVGRGGCSVRGGGVMVDATLDGVLKALKAAMKGTTDG